MRPVATCAIWTHNKEPPKPHIELGETMTGPKLEPQAQLLVEQHVRLMVGTWLKWLGVANVLALVAMAAYVAFVLPDIAAERLVPNMNRRIEGLTRDLEKALAQGFMSAGKVEGEVARFQDRSTALNSKLQLLETDLTSIQATNFAEVAKLVRSLGESRDASGIIQRLGELERVLVPLRTASDAVQISINNPLMSGANQAVCPPGTAITSISATKGVGGKYASDGISEITVRCTPLLAR